MSPAPSSYSPWQQQLAALLLARQTILEPLLLRRALRYCGSAAALLQLSDRQARDCVIQPEQQQALQQLACQWQQPERQLERDLKLCEQCSVQVLTMLDAQYPPLLAEIDDPPPVLFVRGDLAQLQRPMVAVVGSRHCTPQGAENAFSLSRQMAARGLSVVSGLALGIDAAAHRGALQDGGGTIAVLGCGIEQIYPRRHRRLYQQIAQQGALVSEFPPGTPPLPAHFPQRNRIISGLALALIVVEAARPSGSLISAAAAVRQNREVFAVPGSIHNPQSRGCHALLRQGAALLETVDDLLPVLQGWLGPESATSADSVVEAPTLPVEQQRLLQALGEEPSSVNQLQQRSGLALEQLMPLLLELELSGYLRRQAGLYLRCYSASSDLQ